MLDGTSLEETITGLRMGDRVTRLPWSVADGPVGTCWDGPDGCPMAVRWLHFPTGPTGCFTDFVNILEKHLFTILEIDSFLQLFEVPKIFGPSHHLIPLIPWFIETYWDLIFFLAHVLWLDRPRTPVAKPLNLRCNLEPSTHFLNMVREHHQIREELDGLPRFSIFFQG